MSTPEPPLHVRRCRDCGEEYRPEIARCSDCGGTLEDVRLDDADGAEELPLVGDAGPTGAPEVAGGVLGVLFAGSSAEVRALAARLQEAGVPFRVKFEDGLAILVPLDREAEARRAAGDLLGEPVESVPGRCPACGAPLQGEAKECPECRLALSTDETACPACQALVPAGGPCPRCSMDPSQSGGGQG